MDRENMHAPGWSHVLSTTDDLDELEAFRGRPVVVYCHHGVRSLDGAAYLRSRGLEAVSLHGGIELYAQMVDPRLPRY